jgi:hypothetical protein
MADSENIKERVFQFIKLIRSNPNRFQESIGVSGTYLKTVKNIGADKVSKILERYPQLNPEWLLMGKGEILKSEGDITNDIGTIKDIVGNHNITSTSGHAISIANGQDYEKIIEGNRIELTQKKTESKIYLQEINSLKAEIQRLEAYIKSKDEIIAAKNELINVLKDR